VVIGEGEKMRCFIDYLKKEGEDLAKEIGNLRRKLKNSPKGRLEIKKNKSRVQYYLMDKEKNAKLKYIRKNDRKLACQIAQRDYDLNALRSLEQRYKAVHDVYDIYKSTDTSKQFRLTNAERRKLIIPRICDLSDEEYAAQWQKTVYQGKVFAQTDPEIYTVKGERVRSKSEKIIADLLERERIPYRYEYPICLTGDFYIYPDFLLLNKRTREEFFLEHFGMMDNPDYAEGMIRKLEEYEKCGIYPGKKLLMTFETKNRPLNTAVLDMIIQEFLL